MLVCCCEVLFVWVDGGVRDTGLRIVMYYKIT